MEQKVPVVLHCSLSPWALTAEPRYHTEPMLEDQESVAELFPHDNETFRLRGGHGAEDKAAHKLGLEKNEPAV